MRVSDLNLAMPKKLIGENFSSGLLRRQRLMQGSPGSPNASRRCRPARAGPGRVGPSLARLQLSGTVRHHLPKLKLGIEIGTRIFRILGRLVNCITNITSRNPNLCLPRKDST